MAADSECCQAAQCDVMHNMAAGARPFPGMGPDEEEEEELSALMQKLRAAKPPADVMKVCFGMFQSTLLHNKVQV